MSTSRRDFLVRGGTGALAAALAGGAGVGLSAGGVSAAESSDKKVKFRVSARTGTLGKGGPEALELAKKLGIEGVEFEAGGAAEKLQCWDPDYQKSLLEAAEKTGVAVSSICMGLCNSNPVFSDPRAESWLKGTVDATKALGAKNILVAFFGKGNMRNKPAEQAKTIEIMKRVAGHAEKQGITLGLENTLSAETNMEIVGKIGSPTVKVYYDIGNSTYNNYDVPKEIRMLGKQIAIVHFKDGGHLLGQGRCKMGEIGQAMRDIAYEGWIVLETRRTPTGAKYDAEQSAIYNTAFIRGLFA